MHFQKLNLVAEKSNVGMNCETRKPQFSFFTKRAVTSLAIASGLLLSACAQDEEVPLGQIGYVQGFYGAISGDEPTSVLVGRDVLTAGGTAADAAIAMSFTMAATYPGRAGLGAGGVCLMHDGAIGLTETLDFTGGEGSLKTGDRAAAIPGMVRGMAVMHARYGTMDWRQLVLPAEQYARYGHRFSRAARADVTLAEGPLMKDANVKEIFVNEEGWIHSEGYRFDQVDLAATLAQIRAKGAGAFYQGPFARQVAEGIQAAGGNVSEEDLRNYLPEWRGVYGVQAGNYTFYTPEAPAGGGAVMAEALALANADERYEDLSGVDRLHLLLEASKRAYAHQQEYVKAGWEIAIPVDQLSGSEHAEQVMSGFDISKVSTNRLANVKFSENSYNTGFVVVDRSGNAAICDISLNNLFGTGRMAEGLGFMIAASPDKKTRNPLNLAPMAVISTGANSFHGAIAGAGGSVKKLSAMNVMLDVAVNEKNLIDALVEPRMGLSPDLGTVLVEDSFDPEVISRLKEKGYRIDRAELSSRLNAVYCKNGLPREDVGAGCLTFTDPRGHGLSLMTSE
ncbi:gamma-glutamyltransferase [Curvivirga sp.]|uniref:gamma-glutamyltransferase n=1 Tax=Curvivirga sp. TaxID=2856848 RepID=UPI003B5AAE3E